MEKMVKNLSALKYPLAVNCILLSLSGCDQTPPPSSAVAPTAKSGSAVVSVPAPPQQTGSLQSRPESMRPSNSSPPNTRSSWVTAAPPEFGEESSLRSEEQDSRQWEPEQENRNYNTEEYADIQAESLLAAPPAPSDWLDQIEERLLVGEPEEARAALDAFYLIYPDHPVEKSLEERVYGPE